jgi:DNA-binding Lrp family transcriptional regulator
MIVVFVFIKAASPAALATLGQSIADVPGVYECYSVTGEHDFIAVLRLATHDEIADVVTGRLASIDGIAATQTTIAFRSYSSADLGQL